MVGPDAEIVEPLRHQLGMIGMEKLVKQHGVFGMLQHHRAHHDNAGTGIGGQIDEIGIAPAQLTRIPRGEGTVHALVSIR